MALDALVIGSGFSGLAAATTLARLGHTVTVVDRHSEPGGRARSFEMDGFLFDMGPSWYWMPDVFESFFSEAGSDVRSHLDLVRLDPSYTVWFDRGPMPVPAGREAVAALFEDLEPGAGARLHAFLDEAERKYRLSMNRFVRRTAHSVLEFVDPKLIPEVLGLSLFGSLSRHVRSKFSHPDLVRLLEFPVLFLGARPERTPALYSIMNHADTDLGTWYPMGGMHTVVDAMVTVAEGLGVEFMRGVDVRTITVDADRVSGVETDSGPIRAHTVVAAADYHHVEQSLLPKRWRRYDEAYWDRRVMSPGSLLFFLGVDGRIPALTHHNLFFDVPFEPHAQVIYDNPGWPEDPLFYVCAPSRTDPSVAPSDAENLFVLVPLAAGLAHDSARHEEVFQRVMNRLQTHLGFDLRPRIRLRRDYAHRDFESDYNAFRGNAYGLANTLGQTAFLKPKMRSRLPGLFFAGQLTTPGPGVPPSLISGQVAAREASGWLGTIGRSAEVAA